MTVSVDSEILGAALQEQIGTARARLAGQMDSVLESVLAAADQAVERLVLAARTAARCQRSLDEAVAARRDAADQAERLVTFVRGELDRVRSINKGPVTPREPPVQVQQEEARSHDLTDRSTPIACRLLGQFEMNIFGRLVDLHAIGGAKSQSILEYLLAHHGELVQRDALIEAVWPSIHPDDGRRRLHQAIYSLRQVLVAASGGAVRIEFARGAYRVSCAEPMNIDAMTFENLAQQGCRLVDQGDPAAAAPLLQQAIRLYEGDLLTGCDAEWAEGMRERLRRRFVGAAHNLGEILADRGDHAESIEVWERLMKHDPWHEHAAQGLMRALLALGHPSQACQVYSDWSHRLERDLDVSPSSETQRLYSAVLEASHR